MVLPIDKLLDTKVRTNNTMTQGVQSQQVKQDGSIRNVFRNREVR
jgi:hypothetical protein